MMTQKKRTILVVDDLPDNIAILEGILKEDYRVKAATSGEAALAIARTDSPPDLILLDVMMPGMDGYEVCRRLKRDGAGATIPVIFVTAKDEVADESRGFEVGAVDYIAKPVNPHIVKARIKAHLELKLAREELERQNEVLRENARLREEVEHITRHDLKNPLTVILNIPGLFMKQENVTLPQKKLLKMVEDAGYRMLEMINRSIDIYKMEIGMYTLHLTPVNILQILEQIAVSFREMMEQKKLELEVSVRGNPPQSGDTFIIQGEDLLVYSMLANLLKNAVEASPEGEKIKISFSNIETAHITIHNKGAIPEKIRGRFFEKYATYGKESGTGLGAYSAWLIARTLGGAIGFETSDQTGTTITIRLPYSQ